ncbi:MAG: hypothetical protein KF825_02260 [Ferruginibacter sp.]|nr:hypothetical protein [Ferruginibacter sp.]
MQNAELIKLLNEELPVCIAANESWQQIQQQLAKYINTLLQNDFNRLVTYLYRIDVSEQKLKTLLQQNTGKNAGDVIADLIIERQLQKIKTRRQYNQGQHSFDDEEKW